MKSSYHRSHSWSPGQIENLYPVYIPKPKLILHVILWFRVKPNTVCFYKSASHSCHANLQVYEPLTLCKLAAFVISVARLASRVMSFSKALISSATRPCLWSRLYNKQTGKRTGKSVIGSNIHIEVNEFLLTLDRVFESSSRERKHHVTKISSWEAETSWKFQKHDPKWVKNSLTSR